MKPRAAFGKLSTPKVQAVTASSPSPSGVVSELHAHIRSLSETLPSGPTSEADRDVSHETLRIQCEDLGRIHKALVDEEQGKHASSASSLSSSSVKEAFRRFDGFKVLLRLLHGLGGFFSADDKKPRPRDERMAFLDLLKLMFETIGAAFEGHPGNRRYFGRRLDQGGWFLLAQGLVMTGILDAGAQDSLEVLFGQLFDLAIGENRFRSSFRGIEKPDNQAEGQSGSFLQQTQKYLNVKFDTSLNLHIPEVVNVIIQLWTRHLEYCREKGLESALLLAIPLVIQKIQLFSIRNQVSLHTIAVFPSLFEVYLSTDFKNIRTILKPILDNLIKYGVPNLTDSYKLYRNAINSDECADLVLKGMQIVPPFIHFDLSHCGYSCVELSSLGQPFPPQPATGYTIAMWLRFDEFDTHRRTVLFGAQDASLTCNILLYVESGSKHLVLQTNPSSSTERPTVFRSVKFVENRWYHVAITHKRVRTGPIGASNSTKANLFVDGNLLESVRCTYPSTPPPASQVQSLTNQTGQIYQTDPQRPSQLWSRTSSSESFASLSLSGLQQSISAAANTAISNVTSSNSNEPGPVSAFIGSPEGITSTSTSRGDAAAYPRTKWSLSSFHLIRETLSEDFIRIIHGLGPRYAGNFQDVLGSFQTYGSAAGIHVVNEEQMLAGAQPEPGRPLAGAAHPDRTELARALSRPGNNVLHESKIAVGIWASGVVSAEGWEAGIGEVEGSTTSTNSEIVLMRNLGRDAAKTLHRLLSRDPISAQSPIDQRNMAMSVGRHTGLVLNGAIPDYNLALSSTSGNNAASPIGYGLLTGSPTIFAPSCSSMADAAWRIAGCAPPLLKMLSRARNKEEVLRAVAIIFDALQVSWRNSEAVERENGYLVLAGVMREKLGFGSMFGDEFQASVNPTSNPSAGTDLGGGSVPNGGPVLPSEREELALELLRMSLKFVGYSERDPDGSVLTNSMAYRGLLVEFDTWRKAPMATQKLYYAQFVRFAGVGRYGRFNARRVVRMRLIKRFIDALKGESFTNDIFPDFLEAFNAVFRCTVSSDTLRSVSLFITYALHEHRAFPSYAQGARPISSAARSGTASPFAPKSDTASFKIIPRFEIGVRMLEDFTELLCNLDRQSEELMRRFATSVTNKWLLHLLAERDSRVVVLSTKILARLLVLHGGGYVRNFAEKTGGFQVMARRLRPWWSIPGLWMNLFAILFNVDVATMDYEGVGGEAFNQFTLAEAFSSAKGQVVWREVIPVMTAMLEEGLKCVVKDSDTETFGEETGKNEDDNEKKDATTGRARSGSTLKVDMVVEPSSAYDETNNVEVINAVARFLAECHLRYVSFRDFTVGSTFVQEVFAAVFPVVVTGDIISPDTEIMIINNGGPKMPVGLNDEGRNSPAPNNGQHLQLPLRPPPAPLQPGPPKSGVRHHRAASFRRPSSFILVSQDSVATNSSYEINPPKPVKLNAKYHSIVFPTADASLALRVGSNIIQTLLGIITAISLDQVLHRKDFTGFSFANKMPAGTMEQQAAFESYMHSLIMKELSNTIRMQEKVVFTDTRVIMNLHRYFVHVTEIVFEGWWIEGADKLLDFLGQTLELLQKPENAKLKTVRLCSQQVAMIKNTFQRVTLFMLAELHDAEYKSGKSETTAAFLEKLHYWQGVFLGQNQDETRFLRLFFFHMYLRIANGEERVRASAIQLFRILLMHKEAESAGILRDAVPSSQRYLANGFLKLVELDDENFLVWVDVHRSELDGMFVSPNGLARYWEEHINAENARIEDTAMVRLQKRKDVLKRWAREELGVEDVWRKHEGQTTHWRNNVFASERIRHQKLGQDQQDTLIMAAGTVDKFDRILEGPCGIFEDDEENKNVEHRIVPKKRWQLDETEGQNRMRLRIVPDRRKAEEEYQPKRKEQNQALKMQRARTMIEEAKEQRRETARQSSGRSSPTGSPVIGQSEGFAGRNRADSRSSQQSGMDEYEIVEDPHRTEDGEFEDKNRKVTRTLQPKDMIQHVTNVSRIEGLEAIEGLLVVGKDCMYLIDHYFQRSDGEVVGVWQAPVEERDRYLRMISGRETTVKKPKPGDRTRRHWRWADVLLISKRRFLLRDVALEIFFTDGRGYLLTSPNPERRNELYSRLVSKSPLVNNPPSSLAPEDLLRVEALRSIEDQPQSLGSKFASVFNSAAANPATRKWMRGELSNFAYLMQINTMAGRTFNDLTQYPVFPWILADYTSEELDLSDPLTFRDFSKPMGAQDPVREGRFRKMYEEVSSMSGDPPHHYGTHYSSAMTVCQYLMRLQPFVKSYLLLQGGKFDIPDRLFFSIHEAWISASKKNQSDVRELIPEFFYLPEFLVNLNSYDFGQRQLGEKIDNVELPPWAKGDPQIFIQKHREALESQFVSANLHKWIDLVFGTKQQGEAAVESTNVFHYLSYHGAKDLDAIQDTHEQLAAIGIIHNFGQTPRQVFTRPHPQRDVAAASKFLRDNDLNAVLPELTRGPSAVLDIRERVASLIWSSKVERILATGPYAVAVPPLCEAVMRFGFLDGSMRFFTAPTEGPAGGIKPGKQVMHMEQIHCGGGISTALFVDGKTLVTAGRDGVVTLFNVSTTQQLQISAGSASSSATSTAGGLVSATARGTVESVSQRDVLFGHRYPVTLLSASKSLATLLSADTSGRVLMWDVNRGEFVREIAKGMPPPGKFSDGRRLKREDENTHVRAMKICSATGETVLCVGKQAKVLGLNGELLVDSQVASGDEEGVTACTWYDGGGKGEWVERILLLTGHKNGVVKIWTKTTSDPKSGVSVDESKDASPSFILTLLRRLAPPGPYVSPNFNHGHQLQPHNVHAPPMLQEASRPAAVTSILARARCVYVGDEMGRVFEWRAE